MPRRIVFFGTPDLAAQILQTLNRSREFEIVGVVSNPDARVGRGKKLMPSAVKNMALELGIQCVTPQNMDDEFLNQLRAWEADMFVVVAYGRILSREIFDMPEFGTFNLHFSLLPQYRGASPVQSALLNGETRSGYTIFRLVEEMDAGEIFVQQEMELGEMNASEVFAQMIDRGGEVLKKFCTDMVQGKSFSPQAQDDSCATYCSKFRKRDGQIFPLRETSGEILRKYRAFFLWPGIFYLSADETRIKILEIQVSRDADVSFSDGNEVFVKYEGRCFLRTADGCVEVIGAQPEGKKPLSGIDFFNWWQQRR